MQLLNVGKVLVPYGWIFIYYYYCYYYYWC